MGNTHSQPAGWRKFLIALSIVVVSQAPAFGASAENGTKISANAPNIVLIMTDDQHYDSLRFMPHVTNDLLPISVNFTNAFVTTPNCCPARAGFLTGRYNYAHGVFTNGGANGGAGAYTPTMDIAEVLQQAGYRTGLFGKWLTNYNPNAHDDPRGWDSWITYATLPGEDVPQKPGQLGSGFQFFNWTASTPAGVVKYGDSPEDYSTDVFAAGALNFVDTTHDKPFFLQFSPFAPHLPATEAPRHADVDTSAYDLPRTPNYGRTTKGQTWGARMDRDQWKRIRELIDRRTRQQILSLLAVDDAVGKLLHAVKNIETTRKTVVIFTSDNGFAWGEHRWNHKLCPYDVCMKIPLLVHLPDGVLDTTVTPGENTQVVTNLDLAATLLDFAGLDTLTNGLEGDSLRATLVSAETAVRDRFYMEMYGTGSRMPRKLEIWQGVRTNSYKYLNFPDGDQELYDLKKDPWELNNVAAEPEHRDRLADMKQEMQEHLKLQFRKKSTTLVPFEDSCSSANSSNKRRFVLPENAGNVSGEFATVQSIAVAVSRDIRLDDPKKLIVKLVTEAQQTQQLQRRGADDRPTRLSDYDELRATIRPPQARQLIANGATITVEYPDTRVLEFVCKHPPKLRQDVVVAPPKAANAGE